MAVSRRDRTSRAERAWLAFCHKRAGAMAVAVLRGCTLRPLFSATRRRWLCDQKAVTRTDAAGAPSARSREAPGAPAARAEEPRNFNFNFGLTADWPVVIVAVAVGIAGAAKLYTEAFGSERRKQDRADARAQRRGELWDGANATASRAAESAGATASRAAGSVRDGAGAVGARVAGAKDGVVETAARTRDGVAASAARAKDGVVDGSAAAAAALRRSLDSRRPPSPE